MWEEAESVWGGLPAADEAVWLVGEKVLEYPPFATEPVANQQCFSVLGGLVYLGSQHYIEDSKIPRVPCMNADFTAVNLFSSLWAAAPWSELHP